MFGAAHQHHHQRMMDPATAFLWAPPQQTIRFPSLENQHQRHEQEARDRSLWMGPPFGPSQPTTTAGGFSTAPVLLADGKPMQWTRVLGSSLEQVQAAKPASILSQDDDDEEEGQCPLPAPQVDDASSEEKALGRARGGIYEIKRSGGGVVSMAELRVALAMMKRVLQQRQRLAFCDLHQACPPGTKSSLVRDHAVAQGWAKVVGDGRYMALEWVPQAASPPRPLTIGGGVWSGEETTTAVEASFTPLPSSSPTTAEGRAKSELLRMREAAIGTGSGEQPLSPLQMLQHTLERCRCIPFGDLHLACPPLAKTSFLRDQAVAEGWGKIVGHGATLALTWVPLAESGHRTSQLATSHLPQKKDSAEDPIHSFRRALQERKQVLLCNLHLISTEQKTRALRVQAMEEGWAKVVGTGPDAVLVYVNNSAPSPSFSAPADRLTPPESSGGKTLHQQQEAATTQSPKVSSASQLPTIPAPQLSLKTSEGILPGVIKTAATNTVRSSQSADLYPPWDLALARQHFPAAAEDDDKDNTSGQLNGRHATRSRQSALKLYSCACATDPIHDTVIGYERCRGCKESTCPLAIDRRVPFSALIVGSHEHGADITLQWILKSSLQSQRPSTDGTEGVKPRAVLALLSSREDNEARNVLQICSDPAVLQSTLVFVSPACPQRLRYYRDRGIPCLPLIFDWSKLSAAHIVALTLAHCTEGYERHSGGLFGARVIGLLRHFQSKDLPLPASFSEFCEAFFRFKQEEEHAAGEDDDVAVASAAARRFDLMKYLLGETAPAPAPLDFNALLRDKKPFIVVDMTDPLLSEHDTRAILFTIASLFRQVQLPSCFSSYGAKMLVLSQADAYLEGDCGCCWNLSNEVSSIVTSRDKLTSKEDAAEQEGVVLCLRQIRQPAAAGRPLVRLMQLEYSFAFLHRGVDNVPPLASPTLDALLSVYLAHRGAADDDVDPQGEELRGIRHALARLISRRDCIVLTPASRTSRRERPLLEQYIRNGRRMCGAIEDEEEASSCIVEVTMKLLPI